MAIAGDDSNSLRRFVPPASSEAASVLLVLLIGRIVAHFGLICRRLRAILLSRCGGAEGIVAKDRDLHGQIVGADVPGVSRLHRERHARTSHRLIGRPEPRVREAAMPHEGVAHILVVAGDLRVHRRWLADVVRLRERQIRRELTKPCERTICLDHRSKCHCAPGSLAGHRMPGQAPKQRASLE
eukprot:CAMPEP_0180667456 /NCGR_PEP_ID=MMETSP1037_2-20121125/62387_1 /TAXON_ID=632150 /ORGANISM="Azadinium spinosum, Strain 3D9" /LENGTH=183 /DNA_ID=CAMNT_0022696091 /DNA_START=121 /DNA_END=669 /DNA_ORIENTATION=-